MSSRAQLPFLCRHVDEIRRRRPVEPLELHTFLEKKLPSIFSGGSALCPKVLILTERGDVESDLISLHLLSRGVDFVRLNREDIPFHCSMSFKPSEPGKRLTLLNVSGRYIKPNNIKIAIFRRFGVNDFDYIKSGFAQKFAREQWKSAIQILKGCFSCKWINDPDQIVLASDRAEQLSVASAVGFDIPATIITNDPSEAKTFYLTHDAKIVVKALTHHMVRDAGKYFSMYTHFVVPKDVKSFVDLAHAPCVLQEWIPRKSELRVTVIGDQVFAAQIDLPRTKSPLADIHRGFTKKLTKKPVRLKKAIRNKCVTLVRKLGLLYGAIDFMIKDGGRMVFLEVNPIGDWVWLENETGLRITEGIADFIEQAVKSK